MAAGGHRKSIAFFITLGACLVALAVALQVGWVVLNWRTGVLLVLGVLFFILIISGVVLNKNGSFQTTFRYRGPDLDSSTESELVSTCARLNNIVRRLGSGWALYFDAVRRETTAYPRSRFPDSISSLIDEERRASFESGEHFESTYYCTLIWMPPPMSCSR